MLPRKAAFAAFALAFAVPAAALSVGAGTGCAGAKLTAPFDQMAQGGANTTITVLRLQNFEPQPQAAAAAAPMQVPPQIQQWLTAGAQMLPPGLIPPNLIPGAQATPIASSVPRYHNFPILGTAQVTNPKTRDEIFDILGKESSFVAQSSSCMYAEFGIAIQQMNMAPAEVLVSLSCSQVQSFNMAWPYNKNGIPPETAKRIVAVMQKSFGG